MPNRRETLEERARLEVQRDENVAGANDLAASHPDRAQVYATLAVVMQMQIDSIDYKLAEQWRAS